MPRFCIPRQCLPLAALQLGNGPDGSEGPYPRFFSAHIAPLEESIDGQSEHSLSSLLIAEASIQGNGLYAIERVEAGLHTLVKLAETIKLRDIQRFQPSATSFKDSKQTVDNRALASQDDAWWNSIRVPRRDFKRRNLEGNIKSRVLLQVPSEVNPSLGESLTHLPSLNQCIGEQRHIREVQPMIAVERAQDEDKLQGPEAVFATIRTQYREALYVSKTSLAYFAKGPLARARGIFISSEDGPFSSNLLIEQLSAGLLPFTVMDKKYRETVPNIVRELPAVLHEKEDCELYLVPLRNKAKKSKTDKVNKSGLHPGEQIDIARWWLTSDCSDFSDGETSSHAELLKSRVSKLRERETQAQIILALEIIAMEQRKKDAFEPSMPQDADAYQDKQIEKRKKAKKSLDPKTLLEMMLDRLCIWQSMAADERSLTPHSKSVKPQSARNDSGNTSYDGLKNFCIDVIVPFYSSRLPDLTASICKKLGAPTPPSPARPSGSDSLRGPGSKVVKPGAAIRRPPVTKRPRKTLERVLTESKIRPSPRSRSNSTAAPPSLHRSITESALPSLKREHSEQSLVSIPPNRAPSIHVQKRYSQREVDLCSAAAAATEAKLKRRAVVEQELKGAIAAMKKPNARMAVKELIEASEERKKVTEKGRKRKSEPVRNPFAGGLGVQVMATPMKSRTRGLLQRPGLPRMAATQPLPFLGAPEREVEEAELEEIPQSSVERVSESIMKPSVRRDDAHHRGIEHTPTKGSARLTSNGLAPASRGALHRSFTTPSVCRQTRRPSISSIANPRLGRPSLPTSTPRRAPALPTAFATPSKPASMLKVTPLRRSVSDLRAESPKTESHAVGETPQKEASRRSDDSYNYASGTVALDKDCLASSPPVSAPTTVEPLENEKDIYAALGWDNDIGDDLLM